MPFSKFKQLQRVTHIAFSIFAISSLPAYSESLDEAVSRQLERDDLGLPCVELFDDVPDDTDNPLYVFCNRGIVLDPDLSVYDSIGGSSATPNTSISSLGFSDEANRSNSKNTSISIKNGKWGIFLTIDNKDLDRISTETEDSFTSGINRVLIGSSYVPSSTSAFSLVLNSSRQSGDFDSSCNIGNKCDFNYDSTGLRFIGAFKPIENYFLQISLIYDDFEVERNREASFIETNDDEEFQLNGNPSAQYGYNQYGLSLRTGYEFNFGRLSVTPLAGLDSLNSDYGTYSEKGSSGMELTFHDDERESLLLELGLQTNYAIGTSYGVFIPQINIQWRKQFEHKARDVNVSFVFDENSKQFTYQTDALDEYFVDASLGAVFVFKNGTQTFVNIQKLYGHDYFESQTVSAGLRLEL